MRGYGEDVQACTEDLERSIAREMKALKVQKGVLKALNDYADFYGGYSLREHKAETLYTAVSAGVRDLKFRTKQMIKRQKKSKK